MENIKENCYGYHTKHGDLILYGNNIKVCKPYMDGITTDCIEDVCEYCSKHDIRIFHKFNYSICGLIEFILVYFLTKKYGVRSSWKELLQYLKSI